MRSASARPTRARRFLSLTSPQQSCLRGILLRFRSAQSFSFIRQSASGRDRVIHFARASRINVKVAPLPKPSKRTNSVKVTNQCLSFIDDSSCVCDRRDFIPLACFVEHTCGAITLEAYLWTNLCGEIISAQSNEARRVPLSFLWIAKKQKL